MVVKREGTKDEPFWGDAGSKIELNSPRSQISRGLELMSSKGRRAGRGKGVLDVSNG